MDGPVIGLTLDHEGEPPRARLRDTYYDAVRAAGGFPVLLPPIAEPAYVARALDLVDGVLVGGGDDLHPTLWGETEVHPTCTLLTARRQAFDLAVARAALARGIPYLGICCGMQVLNVAAGGSIIQDLPTGWPGSLAHKAAPDAPTLEHPVRVREGSRLGRAAGGAARVQANSLHHQAVGRVGEGLVAVAHAEDGVIEAIESAAADRFALGVQWHPERLVARREHLALFQALVDAAAARRRRAPVPAPAPAPAAPSTPRLPAFPCDTLTETPR